jgi:hypothetical protein
LYVQFVRSICAVVMLLWTVYGEGVFLRRTNWRCHLAPVTRRHGGAARGTDVAEHGAVVSDDAQAEVVEPLADTVAVHADGEPDSEPVAASFAPSVVVPTPVPAALPRRPSHKRKSSKGPARFEKVRRPAKVRESRYHIQTSNCPCSMVIRAYVAARRRESVPPALARDADVLDTLEFSLVLAISMPYSASHTHGVGVDVDKSRSRGLPLSTSVKLAEEVRSVHELLL